jgi:hypothetical protein
MTFLEDVLYYNTFGRRSSYMVRLRCVMRLILAACIVLLIPLSVGAVEPGPDQYVISEDVTYWTVGNDLLAKVQQTVYDQSWTEVLKSLQIIPQDTTGFLYSYTVTNLGVWDKINLCGIKTFEINWGFKPKVVNYASDIPWTFTATDTGPKWTWTGGSYGLIPGRTAEGLWVFADTGKDEWKQASVIGGANGSIVVTGETTGPVVPEPGTMASLLAGVAGLFAFRCRKIRS